MSKSNVMLHPILALDVGNGYGKASILTDWTQEPMALLPESLRQGMDTTAYVAPDGTIEVYPARPRAARAVRAVKSRLEESVIYLEEKGERYQVAPDVVYAAIVRDLARLANRELAARKSDGLYDVVLTYPAGFAYRHDLLARLKRDVESVEIDGHRLKVLHTLSEPAAVAVDYLHYICHRAKDPVKADRYTILVYDLGHGTFDVAVVTAYADPRKECELHSQDWDPEVGGRVFEELLEKEICLQLRQKVGYEPKTAARREQIRQVAREIKHALSDQDEVEREVVLPDEEVTVAITRQRFEELIAPCLQNTWEIIHSQLQKAQARGIRVDAIVLSGGSSRIPYIERQLNAVTGGAIPVVPYNPSMAVCYGAARYGAARVRPAETAETDSDPVGPVDVSDGRKVLIQHADRAYGIWVPDDTLHGHVHYLIDAKATLPCQSEPLPIVASETGSTKFWLYHSKEYVTGQQTEADPKANCREILRPSFDLPARAGVQFTLYMDENRSIKLACRLPDGKIRSQTIFCGDAVGKES